MSNVIRNCPAYNEKGCLHIASIFPDESMCNRYITFAVPCQDCTDCIMKQIVERLLLVCQRCDACDWGNGCAERECGFYQANEILKLLDIQEVE